jgi:hypothetical protein
VERSAHGCADFRSGPGDWRALCVGDSLRFDVRARVQRGDAAGVASTATVTSHGKRLVGRLVKRGWCTRHALKAAIA